LLPLYVYTYVPSDKSRLGFGVGLVTLSQTFGRRVSFVTDMPVPVDGIILCV
jgi:hypothetical protein